ncbi:MAG: asparaginase [Alphaproteobacteria bacterium]|nr:asparaginase [Alphaproteobacteria bacterium]
MANRTKLPKVAIIGTGGTISFTGRHSLDVYEYMDFGRRQSVAEILARFPEVGEAATIVNVDYAQISSSGVMPSDWLALNERIHALVEAEPDLDGIVLTHGTATLEETAYFLNLTLKVVVPVVVVGAQRPSTAMATDAGINLLGAVRVAGSEAARGLGVLVLLNEEIQAAREVTKTSTFRLETFRSPDLGMLGYADADGRVAIYRRPARRHAPDTEFDTRGLASLPRVDVVYSYAGADGVPIEAFAAAGAEAIVVAAVAPGLPTPAQAVALDAARDEGVLQVISTRAGSGRVLRRGSMAEAGVVAADNLNPQKARVLTMLALTRSLEPEDIQRCFDTY